MKARLLALCLCLLVLVMTAGCHAAETAATPGTYLVGGDINATYLDIHEDGTFSAGASMYASYAMFGDVVNKGDQLLLKTEKDTYTFIIQDGTTLVLSEVEGNAFFRVETGTEFTLWDP